MTYPQPGNPAAAARTWAHPAQTPGGFASRAATPGPSARPAGRGRRWLVAALAGRQRRTSRPVTALDASLGAITRRVGIHVDTWDNIPRQLRVDGRTVRVSWFRSMDAHGLTVATDRGDPIELLVIPADIAPESAGVAMSMAASGKADRRRPTDMLAASIDAARARESEWVGADQEHAWENEGGRTKSTARQGSTPASTV